MRRHVLCGPELWFGYFICPGPLQGQVVSLVLTSHFSQINPFLKEALWNPGEVGTLHPSQADG